VSFYLNNSHCGHVLAAENIRFRMAMKITRRKFIAAVAGGVAMFAGRICLALPVNYNDVSNSGEYILVDGWVLKKSDVSDVEGKG